jgi:hypothetical protein
MSGMDQPPRPSTTEDVPAAPGWVEQSVDEIFASLPRQPALIGLRNAYLDCIAGAGGPGDLDAAHDRCRIALIADLKALLDPGEAALSAMEQKLEALEASITDQV